ncbi:MAG TPA: hypothetical protein VFC52_07935 [Solirubrobacterales bacterium]|nr:hypothetical protein [Solirubrobacterales bacterium]
MAEARYGTIRSSRVLKLRAGPLSIAGPRAKPRAIDLPGKLWRKVRRGKILAKAPSARLPRGLFHRVTRVKGRPKGRGRPRRLRVWVKPVSIFKAFPVLDLKAKVPLRPVPAATGSAQASDGLGDVDLSASTPLIPGLLEGSCGGPAAGWSLSPSGGVRAWINSDLHRRYLVLPYGTLSLTVSGQVGLESVIPQGAHCGVSVPLGGLQGFIPVFGVPVPVFGSASLNLGLGTNAPIKAQANAEFVATGGVELNGRGTRPISELTAHASGSVETEADGELSLGPQFKAGIGASFVNAHVSAQPVITVREYLHACQIDAGFNAGAGVDLAHLHASVTPFTPSTPIYRCPGEVVFDGSPGDDSPPSTLGPYPMTEFGLDSQDEEFVDGVDDSAGDIEFGDSLFHTRVGVGWATWSHGYDGDVYFDEESTDASVELPDGTKAFYLYAEPEPFDEFDIEATADDGTSSGPISVQGEAGARYFGFYATGDKTLSEITVDSDEVLAIGEFGIAR